MGKRVFCRFCEHPAEIIAGVFPAKCEKCDEIGFWSTEPGHAVERKHKKRPRVKFAVTQQDYALLLKRLRIARE